MNQEKKRTDHERRDTGNDTNLDNSNREPARRTEIEQPNPSIATPGIPTEMPARDII